MRGLGWEGTLWCWAVSGEAYWLWAGSPYWIVCCIHPGNGHKEMGYTFADQARKHCLRCNTWLPKHPWYRPPLTDFSQNSGYLLHLVQVSKKKFTAEEESYSILCTNSHCPLSYHHLFFLPQGIIYFIGYCVIFHTVQKCSSGDNKAWTHD